MNTRIRALRKSLDLNQTDFGNRIGVKQTTIAGYETGAKNPLDTVITSMCREFRVNENWLRTGEGQMFIGSVENDLIARATRLLGEKDPLFEAFVYTYSNLSAENRKLFLEFGSALFEEANRRKEEKE